MNTKLIAAVKSLPRFDHPREPFERVVQFETRIRLEDVLRLIREHDPTAAIVDRLRRMSRHALDLEPQLGASAALAMAADIFEKGADDLTSGRSRDEL